MASQTLNWNISLERGTLSFDRRLVPVTGNEYDVAVTGGAEGKTYAFYVMAEDALTCLAASTTAAGATTIRFDSEALANRFDRGWHEVRSFHVVAYDGTSAVAEGDLQIGWNPVWRTPTSGTAATMKGDKGDKGDTGAPGAPGATGSAGPANTIAIGTVQTGQEAAATITGSSPNQTLNLVLPKGDKGDTGAKGDDGDDGHSPVLSSSKTGTTTTITADGSVIATLEDGEDGDDGVSPAVTITPTTGGHTVTITDAAHPQGQSFVVSDGDVSSRAKKPTTGTLDSNASFNEVILKINNLITQLKS